MIVNCGINLYFPAYKWDWVSFHMFIDHLDVPFVKCLVMCSSVLTFLNWDIFFLLNSEKVLQLFWIQNLCQFLKMSLLTLWLSFSFRMASLADFQLIPTPSMQPFEIQTQREGFHQQAGLVTNPVTLAHEDCPASWSLRFFLGMCMCSQGF